MNVKLAFEAPLKSLELSSKFGDYLFAIALWLKHSEYSDFVLGRPESMELYLDNGCYEQGASIDIREYVGYIEGLQPDVAVVPDVYLNYPDTIRMAGVFFKEHLPQTTKYMLVPQGKTMSEWVLCYHKLLRMFRHRFSIVGIPRNMFPHRLQLVRHVYNISKKDIHILGCVEPSEIAGILASNVPVVSIDTSWPARYVLGKLGKEDRIDFETDEIGFQEFDGAVKEFLRRITPERVRVR